MGRGRTKWIKVTTEWKWRADDVLTYTIRRDNNGMYNITLTHECSGPPVTERITSVGSSEYAKEVCHQHFAKNYVPN